jgi:hypothetical protein
MGLLQQVEEWAEEEAAGNCGQAGEAALGRRALVTEEGVAAEQRVGRPQPGLAQALA